MAAELELVDVMDQQPGCCTLCNCTPVDETQEHRPPLPAIHAVGIDVDWGNHVYICWTCASLIADLMERPDADKVKNVITRVKFEKKRADKAEAKVEQLKANLKALVEGKKAVKAAKAELAEGTK